MAVGKSGSKNQFSLADRRRAMDSALRDFPALAVASGECEYLRADAAGRYRAAWLAAHPDGDIVLLRGTGEGRPAGLGDMVRELSGGSLFAREKLVLARQAERILFPQAGRDDGEGAEGEEGTGGKETPPSAGSEAEKAFLAWLDKPAAKMWLFVETAQLPRNRTLGKRLAAAGCFIPCPGPTGRDIPAWLAAKAGEFGARIDEEASDLLMRAHGTDLGILAAEVEKLALFAGEGRDIDADMAREFMTGAVEFDIFALTNAVEERNPVKAMLFARRIASQGMRDQRGKREDGERSAHRALSMLAGTVQGLLRAGIALAERREAAAFAAGEKISPWRAERLMAAAARFDVRELRRMARQAADRIRSAHDTGGDALLSLELMAADLAAGREGTRGRAFSRGAGRTERE